MVTRNENGMMRVTVTLDPEDVELLDELARLEGANRSAELRGLLSQARPIMRSLVATFRETERLRGTLDEAMVNATVSELQAIMPEVEEMNRRFLGTMAKLEGTAAASAGHEEAPGSNTGATNQ